MGNDGNGSKSLRSASIAPVSQAAEVLPKLCTKCGARYPHDALFCPQDGVPLQSARDVEMRGDLKDPYLGRQILEHIEIRELAGVGAMGRVYRAFQKGIDRDVAVKILHRELSANQQLVTRFNREAKVASRLAHPNVVQVHLAGQLPDGALYIVMEFLDGLSLQSALAAAAEGRMPLQRALHLAIQLCDAVGEAHAQGIVHRDLKPENVMLVKRGDDPDFLKVLDFGIARLTWSDHSMATATGLIFGTARYISPEGAQGQHVSPASDVYSLATLLYQMLAGRAPFDADQAVALLIQQIHDPAPQLQSLEHGSRVPDPIAAAVMRNLAKDPAQRDQDARTFGRALFEAAKASGFTPEELMAPSLLREALSPRAPSASYVAVHKPDPVHTAGPRPTTQWTPEADVRAQLSATAPPPNAPVRDAATPNGTVKIDAAMAPALPEAQRTAPLGRVSPGATSVEQTLDDDDGTPNVAPPRQAPRTEYAEPTPPPPPEAQRTSPVPTPLAGRARLSSRDRPTDPGRPHDVPPRRSMSRTVIVVAACFLMGAGLTSAIAYQRGLIGGASAESDREVLYGRAKAALASGHFAEPAGENVRELTDAGRAKYPSDPRFAELRALAARDLTTQAMSKKQADGGAAEALRLIRLARELDPSDKTVELLLTQYEAEAAGKPDAAPMGLAPLRPQPRPSLPGTAPTASTGAEGRPVRVVVSKSPAQPRVGQTVEFAATVLDAAGQKTQAQDAVFAVTGPGVSTRLPATSDGALYRASLSFFDVGNYTVTFTATLDGKRATSSLSFAVTAPGAVTPPVPTTLPTFVPPAPTGSVKWL